MCEAVCACLIESHPHLSLVGEAGSKAEAIAIVSRELPHVILLDLDLNGENGLDLIPELNSVSHQSQILILTGVRDDEVHQQCLRLGARGLVRKESAAEVLVKAIEKVSAGEIWFDRTMMSHVLSDVLNRREAKRVDPETAKMNSLTEREKQIIPLVCEGLKNKQIAERLFISDTTVRHHLTSIFSKLDISDRLELVIYAYRFGFGKPLE
ncbi:MAG: response regulator transcription factor [Pyrinomonadaceae bacterium]